jgi:hypothetical protein
MTMSQQTSIGSMPERAEGEPAPVRRDSGALIGGLVLIILGVIFFLEQAGLLFLRNWWALFILIPAAVAFGNAWTRYHAAGDRFTAPVRGSLIGGFLLLIVTGVFLLDLAWDMIWPAFLIIAGIAVFLNAWLNSHQQ